MRITDVIYWSYTAVLVALIPFMLVFSFAAFNAVTLLSVAA